MSPSVETILLILTVATILVLAATSLALWWQGVRAKIALVKFEENAWQEAREKQMVVEFLHNLTKDIDAERGRDELHPAIVKAAVRGAGARAACFFELGQDGVLRPTATYGIFPPLKDLPPHLQKPDTLRADLIGHAMRVASHAPGESVLSAVARDRAPLFLPDASTSPLIRHLDDPTLRARSLIVTPIAYGKTVYGVLAVANPEDGDLFEHGDFSYVKSIGEQGAVALHLHETLQMRSEKTRIDFDLSIASGVQKLLLPQTLPQNPGLDMHACYRPAKQVGGDLYDVTELGDGRICILAADVSGKGVSASLVMAMAHTHLRHLMRGKTSPAELLRKLNAEMIGEIQRGMFITISCAIIDTTAHTLTLARAGHELPLLLSRQEGLTGPRFEKIRTEGMAIGIVPSDVFDEILTEVTLPFRPGSVVVFFTDGLTEARNPVGEEYGTANLARTVLRTHQYGARDLNMEILAALETFCEGVAPHDDLTLVTVKCVKES